MRYTDILESIEGDALQLQCRKFNAHPPCKDTVLGKLVYPFKLGIFALASITQEFAPKVCVWYTTSHLDAGDALQGEAIEGKCVKPLGKPVVRAATGRHKASFLATRGATLARIEIGTRALLQKAIESRKEE